MEEKDQLLKLLAEAKSVASRYYQLTKKPLGVTGEIAEFEAYRLLGLELMPPRQPGYDATEVVDGELKKLQIKGRCMPNGYMPGQRVGQIKIGHEWDAVLLVLMDASFNAVEIWEADRAAVLQALSAPGSIARNERGALSVAKFKSIGHLRWR